MVRSATRLRTINEVGREEMVGSATANRGPRIADGDIAYRVTACAGCAQSTEVRAVRVRIP